MTAGSGVSARSKSSNHASTTFSFVWLIAYELNEKIPRKANSQRFLLIRNQRSPTASFLLLDRPSNRMSEIKIGERERTRHARSNRRRRFRRHARFAPSRHWKERAVTD